MHLVIDCINRILVLIGTFSYRFYKQDIGAFSYRFYKQDIGLNWCI